MVGFCGSANVFFIVSCFFTEEIMSILCVKVLF